MARKSPPSHTIRPSLVRLALDILMSVVAILRGRWERELVRPFLRSDHRTHITREKFLAMMEMMFRDDARLRREIFETAMRMLGRDGPRLPDSAFALPRPKSARGAWRRWSDYARMISAPQWYAWRLARRLARLGCDACRLDRSAPEHAVSGVHFPLSQTLFHDDATFAVMPSRAKTRAGSRARAPPLALIANSAPCKPPLARSLAFA
jgi:hypothetical protein